MPCEGRSPPSFYSGRKDPQASAHKAGAFFCFKRRSQLSSQNENLCYTLKLSAFERIVFIMPRKKNDQHLDMSKFVEISLEDSSDDSFNEKLSTETKKSTKKTVKKKVQPKEDAPSSVSGETASTASLSDSSSDKYQEEIVAAATSNNFDSSEDFGPEPSSKQPTKSSSYPGLQLEVEVRYSFEDDDSVLEVQDDYFHRNDFPSSVKEAVELFSDKAQFDKSGADHDQEAHAQAVAGYATQTQRVNMGQFYPHNNHKSSVTVSHFKNSSAGIIRMPKETEAANMYINAYRRGNEFSVHVGAAQGLNEEFNTQRQKYSLAKQQNIEKQLLTHLAAALIGHMVQHEYNTQVGYQLGAALQLADYNSPQVLQLSNYMTDLNFLGYGDAKQIKPRKEYLKQLQKDLASDDPKARVRIETFKTRLNERLKEMAQEEGLLSEKNPHVTKKMEHAVESVIQRGKLIFNRQGLNAFRMVSAWNRSTTLCQHADQKIQELQRQMDAKESLTGKREIEIQIWKIQSVVGEIKRNERMYMLRQGLAFTTLGLAALALPMPLVSIALTLPVAVPVILNRLGFASSNLPLHKEGLKLNLIDLIDGADVGGCQSAKDRFGSVLCTARAQQDYIDQYGVAPPASSFLNRLWSALGYKNYSQQRADYYSKCFAQHWVSGALQYVAHANAPGSLGIKNNDQIIPKSHRQAIVAEIDDQLRAKYEQLTLITEAAEKNFSVSIDESGASQVSDEINKALETEEAQEILKEMRQLFLFYPKVSNLLSKINEAVKKTAPQEHLNKIQQSCSQYVLSKQEDLFHDQNHQTTLEHVRNRLLQDYQELSFYPEVAKTYPPEEVRYQDNPLEAQTSVQPPQRSGTEPPGIYNAVGSKPAEKKPGKR